MCLAVPGKVIERYSENGILMGRIDYGGVIKSACLAYLPDIELGQYAMVHAGFAVSIVDEAEVKQFFQLWQEVLDAGKPSRDLPV
jgi:hydrogenase expression/formation protein HypC